MPAATASIGAAAALVLATLGAGFVRSNSWSAVMAALVVVCGAVTAIVQIRIQSTTPQTRWQWLSLTGGVLIIVMGVMVSITQLMAVGIVLKATTVSIAKIAPLAGLFCFAGGLGQLPRTWTPIIVVTSLGASATGWFAFGDDTILTRVLVAFSALVTAVACVFGVRTLSTFLHSAPPPDKTRMVRQTIAAVCGLVSLALTSTMMAYTFLVAVTPPSLWQSYAPSSLLACGYVTATLAALAGGMICGHVTPHPVTG